MLLYKIANHPSELSFNTENLLEVTIENRTICIAKFKEQLYAFRSQCPHAGVPLVKGYIDLLGNVVCPLHHYKFNIKTGRNVTGEDYQMKCYEVLVKEEGVFVSLGV